MEIAIILVLAAYVLGCFVSRNQFVRIMEMHKWSDKEDFNMLKLSKAMSWAGFFAVYIAYKAYKEQL